MGSGQSTFKGMRNTGTAGSIEDKHRRADMASQRSALLFSGNWNDAEFSARLVALRARYELRADGHV